MYFSVTAPAGFESYTILMNKARYWHDKYSFAGNIPEIAEAMGLIGDTNVLACGFQNSLTSTRYYIPESVNDYTVVGIAYDEGQGSGYYTYYSGPIINTMKEIYCPPSCRLIVALAECNKLTDIYIAADSFYLPPTALPPLDDYYYGYNPYDPLFANHRRPITIHAQPDAWCEYAGTTIAEYMSDPTNEYKCDFEPWDPSTVY